VSRPTDRQYLPALDGIRAFAVLAVLLYHAEAVSAVRPVFGGGFLGVSVFFTLSGFLIGGQLVREHEASGRVAFDGFARRRIARLAPAALATIAGVVVISRTSWAAWGVPGGFAPSDAVGAAWNVTNWQLIALPDAALFRLINPLTHFWSLAVEAQLYVVLALVCVAAAGRPLRRTLLIAASAGWVLSALIAVVVHGSVRREEFGTDIRLAEFAAGVLLAVLLPRVRASLRDRASVADTLGVLATGTFVAVVLSAGRSDRWLETGGYALLSLVWVAWLIAALEGRWIPRLLALRPLVLVGTISYSLYLVHWPIVLMLADARLGRSGWGAVAIRVVVSLAVGAALHVAVERPARRAVAARSTRQALFGWVGAAAATSMLAIVLLRA
jgi:peptidoglycan/LPS O-acetylase OafA/YrhL